MSEPNRPGATVDRPKQRKPPSSRLADLGDRIARTFTPTPEQGKAPEFAWPTAQAFFNTVRTHTMEGMFADPIYGGNKDFAGWRLVGFPGAQPIYTPADLGSKEAFAREPITGLQEQLKNKRS